MIIAGEASGDLHGASLLKSLKSREPEIHCSGIGGSKMITEGFEAIYHIKDMAFLGFAEVVKHLPFIKKVQKELLNEIKIKNIKHIVLIDYPGFNLNFAKRVKKLGVKVIYYISPQIWAWGKYRIKKIQRLVDLMLVIFPFEKDFYNDFGVNVKFVGHPLIEGLEKYNFLSKEELYSKFNLNPEKEILLIMPGSRKQEIEKIFPETIKAAKLIADKFNLQTVIACPENISEKSFRELSDITDYTIISNLSYDLMKYAKFGIIKSGTSTIEAALFNLPFVVVYSTSKITYEIGKRLVNVKNIAMTNIILGETVVDEFIQTDVKAEKIFSRVSELLNNPNEFDALRKKLGAVKNKLGNLHASEEAVVDILNFVNG